MGARSHLREPTRKGPARVPLQHSPTLGQGRSAAPTSPADVGIAAWPQCAHCSMIKGHWVPVEGYSVEEVKPTSVLVKSRWGVKAECSHGRSGVSDRSEHEVAWIDVPYYWGEAQRLLAIKRLQFFAPGRKAENLMLL